MKVSRAQYYQSIGYNFSWYLHLKALGWWKCSTTTSKRREHRAIAHKARYEIKRILKQIENEL